MNWHLFYLGCCYTFGACGAGLIWRHPWNMLDAAVHLVCVSLVLAWWAA